MFKQWLAKRRAQREYQALVKEARNDWRVVISRSIDCVDTSYGLRVPVGTALFVGEENQLGERRLRTLCDPWPHKKYSAKAEILLWVAKAQPRALPRHELEKA